MSPPVTITSEICPADFSEIIDVRSPAEFAEDHIPGAINLPVLNDEERATIGTIYKQESPFKAKKLGAALVSANIARAIRETLIDRGKDYRPLVYCWRGGQRSMSLATVLARIGWQTTVIEGGYKTYRKWVRKTIEEKCRALNLVVLAGLTGTGKTDILEQLHTRGEQVIDLEGLARHRGSLLGADPEQPQPSQKYFESLLAKTIAGFSPEKTTWVESESNKIGNIHCPESLWQNMKTADMIAISAPLDARVDYLLAQYPHMTDSPELLKKKIGLLQHRHGKEQIEEWLDLIDRKKWKSFVRSMLEKHYDPGYRRAIQCKQRAVISQHELHILDTAEIKRLVQKLVTGLPDNPEQKT